MALQVRHTFTWAAHASVCVDGSEPAPCDAVVHLYAVGPRCDSVLWFGRFFGEGWEHSCERIREANELTIARHCCAPRRRIVLVGDDGEFAGLGLPPLPFVATQPAP
jgi:hypothetical protein